MMQSRSDTNINEFDEDALNEIFVRLKENCKIPAKKRKVTRNLSDEQKQSIKERLAKGKERKKLLKEQQKEEERLNPPPIPEPEPDLNTVLKKLGEMSVYMDTLRKQTDAKQDAMPVDAMQKPKQDAMLKPKPDAKQDAMPVEAMPVDAMPVDAMQKPKQKQQPKSTNDKQEQYNKKLAEFAKRMKAHNIF